MSVFNYLQLQPIDPQDDGTVSTLDQFEQDEQIDLTQETDGEELAREWTEIEEAMKQEDESNSSSK